MPRHCAYHRIACTALLCVLYEAGATGVGSHVEMLGGEQDLDARAHAGHLCFRQTLHQGSAHNHCPGKLELALCRECRNCLTLVHYLEGNYVLVLNMSAFTAALSRTNVSV